MTRRRFPLLMPCSAPSTAVGVSGRVARLSIDVIARRTHSRRAYAVHGERSVDFRQKLCDELVQTRLRYDGALTSPGARRRQHARAALSQAPNRSVGLAHV